ncbi:MAG TPA: OFA family MFS transporter [Spirochaetota bacterium]|nr:OFA family MFS transporter [Spirochaetota bacterium]
MTDSTRVFGMKAESGRWIFVLLGFVINICLGAVYAYSVFKGPVEKQFGATATQGNLPFMLFLAFFAVLMFFGGKIMAKLGPAKTSLIGGVIVGAGWILSYFATNIWFLMVTYGVVAGSGVGLVYGCPIATAAQWFPDRKGLAVGLTVAGFGGSPFVTANIATPMIKFYQEQGSISPVFLILGLVFLAIILLCSIPLKAPVAGWKPAGWQPTAAQAAAAVDLDRSAIVKTGTFWGLLSCFTIGSLAGLMAIGISKPAGQELIGIEAALSGSLVGIFAIFNGLGRPIFGTLTDKITPKYAAAINMGIIMLMSIGMLMAGQGDIALYIGCFIGFWMCLGGWLAIAPTATGTYFGMKNYAQNYGVVFFAYGIGAILGGIISGQAKDMFGSYQVAFYPTAALGLLGVIIALLLIKPVKKA